MIVGRPLAVHGLVAVVALVAAYVAWRHDRTTEEGGGEEESSEVVVADISPSSVKGVVYQVEDRRVEIDLAPTAGEPSWVTVTSKTKVTPQRPTKRPAKRPATDGGVGGDGGALAEDGGPVVERGGDGGADAGDVGAEAGVAEPQPEYREEVVRFAANEVLDELLKQLAPLKAARRLGKLSREQLDEFELAEPQGSLELKLAGEVRRYDVGARTFGAGSFYYILEKQSGEAYLFSSKVIRDLDMARSRLMQRELHRFEATEAAAAVVTAGSSRLELTHSKRHSEQERAWVRSAAPESPNKSTTNWMQQIDRLRALAYPSPDDDFSGEGATPVVRIEYKNEEGSFLGFVEIVRSKSAPPEFFGRSEATGSWVRLSRTVSEQLEADLGGILGE